jgi:hypothetical protein
MNAFSQQKAPVAALAAEIMAAQQKLALRANELRAGKTTPASGDFRMIFAKPGCHDRDCITLKKPASRRGGRQGRHFDFLL